MKRYIYKITSNCRLCFSSGHIILGSLLMALSLLSCSEDLKEELDTPEDNKGMVEVIFSIPDEETIQFVTRAEGDRVDATNVENTFSNIYLVYSGNVKNSEGNDVTIFEIKDLTGQKSTLINGYRDYTLSFTPGQYRFFVVVNYDEYLGEGNTIANSVTSIADIEDKINNFTTSQNILAEHLPMGCLDTEMERNGYRVSSGIVTIDGSNTNVITAPLTFLCAKVRYTILFDATEGGISEDFGEKRIRFDVNNEELPYAHVRNTKINYGQEQDLTELIVNPDFSVGNQPSIDGWTIDPGEKGFIDGVPVARHYNENFNRFQKITGRTSGLYRLEVNGFYRYGRNYHWDYGNEKLSWQAHLDGTEQLYARMYINDSEYPLMSLYDEDYGENYTGTENTYPWWERDANTAFIEGKYKNSVNYILQQDGSLTIGVKKDYTREFDWTCFDKFKLYYKPMTITVGSERTQNIEIQRFDWPDNGIKYPQSATDPLVPNTDSDNDWYDKAQKAWQGVVYLPENLSDNKTVLHFPYCYGNQTTSNGKEKTITLFDKDNVSDPQYNQNAYRGGLKRGMMYDIRIQVINSNEEEDEFILYVTVKNWDYKPSEKEL